MPEVEDNEPLVSVIIPCYNHGHLLANAIQSVKKQTYSNVEIIVVDDGSADNTAEVALGFGQVLYVHQKNSGLAASRNTGIGKCNGAYLVFLDADDILYPDGIKVNLNILRQHQECAFVSGAHDKVYLFENRSEEKVRDIYANHYENLLQGNYIAMIAAVLFQRWAFDENLYDVSLRACEDYDIFLKIAGKHPVIHHQKKIAVYNIYASNMSSDSAMMLSSALTVLKNQKKYLRNNIEYKAWQKGNLVWKKYFCKEIYEKLSGPGAQKDNRSLLTLLRYRPRLLLKYLLSVPSK